MLKRKIGKKYFYIIYTNHLDKPNHCLQGEDNTEILVAGLHHDAIKDGNVYWASGGTTHDSVSLHHLCFL